MKPQKPPINLSISKQTVAEMPIAEYSGEIRIVETAADARTALRYLSRQPLVGFDSETRPSFRKGKSHNVALVQLSTDDCCFLFRINKTGLLEPLRNFFESETVMKIGLSIKDDFHGLHRLGEFEPKNFVELQDFVHQWGIADASLQKIYAIIFGERISKGQRLTNWEAEQMTELQQRYAALDAWACLKIYKHLTAGCFHPEKSPYVVVEEEPQQR